MEGNKTKSNAIEAISAGVSEGDNDVAKEVLATITSSSLPPLQQQFSSSGATVTAAAATSAALNSNAVHTIYIPPKVDADRYQAEIPDILPTRPLKSGTFFSSLPITNNKNFLFVALDNFAVLSSKKSSSLSLDDDKREKAAMGNFRLFQYFNYNSNHNNLF